MEEEGGKERMQWPCQQLHRSTSEIRLLYSFSRPNQQLQRSTSEVRLLQSFSRPDLELLNRECLSDTTTRQIQRGCNDPISSCSAVSSSCNPVRQRSGFCTVLAVQTFRAQQLCLLQLNCTALHIVVLHTTSLHCSSAGYTSVNFLTTAISLRESLAAVRQGLAVLASTFSEASEAQLWLHPLN